MGLRALILLLVVGLLIWLVRGLLAKPRNSRPSSSTPGSKMLPCARCGLHVPEDEAVMSEGNSYCCEAHRRLGTTD